MVEPEDPLNRIFPAQVRLVPAKRKVLSTLESRYWASFKTKNEPSSFIHPITAIDFSPVQPHDMALSSSASLSIYSTSSFSPVSTLSSSFTDIAYSPSYRCDGLLLAAGSHSGTLHIFDPAERKPLRILRSHSRPAHLVRFPRLADKLHLFSAADDALLNYWDVASETTVLSFQSHKDYVRSGSASPISPHLFTTGSYDHSLRLWDVRNPSTLVLECTHGSPVEAILFLPSGGLIASAGGNCIKLWDIIGGGRLLHTVENHNKTVTSLCTAKFLDGGEEQSRLLSVSLDGYMKVFDYGAFKVTHSMRYPAPLLSVGFSPSGSGRVAGSSNGILFIGQRKKKDPPLEEGADGAQRVGVDIEKIKTTTRNSNFRYFSRSQNEKPSEADFVIKKKKKVELSQHDKLLNKFLHQEALISALNEKNPRTVMAIMEELESRNKLMTCISNLNVDELSLFLDFLQRYLVLPEFAGFLVGLTMRVLVLRAEDIKVSASFKAQMRSLKRVVAEELKMQHSLKEILGIVAPLLHIAGR